MNPTIDDSMIHDLVVVGAAQRGLWLPSTRHQKGWTCWSSKRVPRTGRNSSKIENYLGFPTGISGEHWPTGRWFKPKNSELTST
jgi:hypothetical protein